MATLAPSLKGLFASIDFLWPARDRRTDGWYRPVSAGYSKGHNPGHNGLVHAIDVDADGINEMWIIDHIHRTGGVIWYIIWDVRVWSTETGWNGHPYKVPPGGSLHKDHMHIEIYQTNTAEQFAGPWFGSASGSSGGSSGSSGGTGISSGLGAADPRDYRDAITATASWADFVAGRVNSAAQHIIGSRDL